MLLGKNARPTLHTFSEGIPILYLWLRMGFRELLTVIGLVTLSRAASAMLLSIDWQTARDNLPTRETNSNLDWLELIQTYNQTETQATAITHKGAGFVSHQHPGFSVSD
jgi:hypothetical protein